MLFRSVKEDSYLCFDSPICDKRFQDLVNGIDYFETTVDLNTFECKERTEYLSQDKVIGFLAHSTLALLKWQAPSVRMCLIYHFQESKKKVVKEKKDSKEECSLRIQRSHKCFGKSSAKGKQPLFWNCSSNIS